MVAMKRLSLLLTFFAISISLTSCGKSFFQLNAGESDRIVLRVWEGSKGADEFIRAAARDYRMLHGDVDFIVETVEPSEVLYQLSVDLPRDEAADIFCATSDMIPFLVENDLICEIKDLSNTGTAFLSHCIEDVSYRGKKYGAPVSIETNLLYYNRSLIHENEVPKTWGEMMTRCRKFNIKNPDKKALVFNARDGFVALSFATQGKSGIFFSREDGSVSINRDGYVDFGMDFLKKFRPYLDVDADEMNGEYVRDMFRTGRAAMVITDSSDVRIFEDAPVNFGVTVLPGFANENQEFPLSTYRRTRGMFVSSASKHYDKACSFVKYVASADMQQKRFSFTGAVPAVELELKNPVVKLSKKQLPETIALPKNPAMPSVWESMNSACEKIWEGKNSGGVLDEVSALLSRLQNLEADAETECLDK